MDKKLICVLCGQEWGVKNPFTNLCENEACNGFCTWGYELNKPESYIIEHDSWLVKLPSNIDDYLDRCDHEIREIKKELVEIYDIHNDKDLIKQLNISQEDKSKLFLWLKYQCAFAEKHGYMVGKNLI